MAFTKILPAGISTTGLVTVDSLSVGDVTLTGDTDNLIINTSTVTVRPTLDLNFARDKRLDSKITFTRNSVGTYVDANGLIQTAVNNIPRFDHDPTTGESLGLLIEQSRTNILPYSKDEGNWIGNSAGTITTNSGIAPDGTNTASKISTTSTDLDVGPVTSSTSGGNSYLSGLTSGATYTYSAFFKASTDAQVGNNFMIRMKRVSGDLVTEASTFALTSDWVRHSITFTLPANVDRIWTYVGGIVGSEALVWGAQVEQGSFTTSYIPTSGSTVTRAVDEATITGTNFTDWYNASEGSIFAKYSAGTNVSESPFGFTKTGSESTYLIAIAASSSGPDIGVVPTIVVADGGVTQTGITVPITPVDGDVIRTAIGYKENDFAIYSATDTESGFASDSSGTIPTVDIARIGKYPYYGLWQNRPIARIMYYPKRLPNAQLQNLTK